MKLSPINWATLVLLVVFLASFFEMGVFGFVGPNTSFQTVIAWQMIASVMLFFLLIAITIEQDLMTKTS
ncbi:MAG: hypothetical protein ACYCQJ_07665 [Nitrososphaerales archaeon]